MSDDTKYVLLHETVWEHIVSDLSTFATVAGIIGLGIFMDSSAMQWAGFILATIAIAARCTGIVKGRSGVTPQQAADYLVEKYNVRAKP